MQLLKHVVPNYLSRNIMVVIAAVASGNRLKNELRSCPVELQLSCNGDLVEWPPRRMQARSVFEIPTDSDY